MTFSTITILHRPDRTLWIATAISTSGAVCIQGFGLTPVDAVADVMRKAEGMAA